MESPSRISFRIRYALSENTNEGLLTIVRGWKYRTVCYIMTVIIELDVLSDRASTWAKYCSKL